MNIIRGTLFYLSLSTLWNIKIHINLILEIHSLHLNTSKNLNPLYHQLKSKISSLSHQLKIPWCHHLKHLNQVWVRPDLYWGKSHLNLCICEIRKQVICSQNIIVGQAWGTSYKHSHSKKKGNGRKNRATNPKQLQNLAGQAT